MLCVTACVKQTPGRAHILGVLGPRIWARPGVFVLHAGQSVISDHTARCYHQQLAAASQTDHTLCDVTVAAPTDNFTTLLIDTCRGGEGAFTAIQCTDILAFMPEYDELMR